MARITGAILNRGNPNFSNLLGSFDGVRGLEDATYHTWAHALLNAELRQAVRLASRWALQGVVFADLIASKRAAGAAARVGPRVVAWACASCPRSWPKWCCASTSGDRSSPSRDFSCNGASASISERDTSAPASFGALFDDLERRVHVPAGARFETSRHDDHATAWLLHSPTQLEKQLVLGQPSEHSRLAGELYYMHFFYRVPHGIEFAGVMGVLLLVTLVSGMLIHWKDLVR